MTGTILIAEDNPGDAVLLRRAFKQLQIINPLQIVRDGREVLDYLQGLAKFKDRNRFPMPVLLLLDLRMPRMDGFEVLRWLRARPRRTYAIVVLTALEQLSGIRRAYRLGADSFLTKPLGLQDLRNLMEGVAGLRLKRSSKGTLLEYTPPFAAKKSA